MTAIYLGMSFLLHIVSFLCIFLLFQKRSVERLNLPSMKEDVETIHQSIQAFVDELEKENEALYKSLVQYVNKKVGRLEGEVEHLQNSLQQVQEEVRFKQMPQVASSQPNSITEPVQREAEPTTPPTPVETPQTERIEPTRIEPKPNDNKPKKSELDPKFEKGIQLYKEGKTADEIAKTLKINPVEANFIVNYAQKIGDDH